MDEMIEVIAIKGQYEDGGDLWFGMDDPEAPQRFFNYFKNNVERDETMKVKIEKVKQSDYDRED